MEAFLLIGMSTPISEALIIYSQLIYIQTNQHIQPTVIAVITGIRRIVKECEKVGDIKEILK